MVCAHHQHVRTRGAHCGRREHGRRRGCGVEQPGGGQAEIREGEEQDGVVAAAGLLRVFPPLRRIWGAGAKSGASAGARWGAFGEPRERKRAGLNDGIMALCARLSRGRPHDRSDAAPAGVERQRAAVELHRRRQL